MKDDQFYEALFTVNDLPCRIRVSDSYLKNPHLLMAMIVEETIHCLSEAGVEIQSFSVEKPLMIEVSR